MLSQEQITDFKNNGYLLVPGILSATEIAFMRERVIEIFDSGQWKRSPYNGPQVLSDVYNFFPEFLDISLKKEVLEIIRSLLGPNPVLMPETAIHYKFFTGWHKDTTSQEKAGHTFHLKPESLMIEAGFYLQDNDKYGGGLTVMPGSHQTSDPFLNPKEEKPGLLKRVVNKISPLAEEDNKDINPHGHAIVDIPSKAGDLVIFNFRLNHRATRPARTRVENVPAAKSKIAFFNAFSVNNPTAQHYLDYIRSRPEPFYQYIRERELSTQLTEKARELKFKAY